MTDEMQVPASPASPAAALARRASDGSFPWKRSRSASSIPSQQRFHRRPATHGGCTQAVARSCDGVPVMHANAQCKTQMHARTHNHGSHFAVWPEPKALPETSKESRNCAVMDHYIAQKASPTCIEPVTSPSCAAGLVDTMEGHPSYEILPTSIVSLTGDFCLTSEHL
ncbi:hypothetical protein TRIATDRAFT_88880 [Trichoderma atroviride IMI 206040]|uniref:Uncharacterized protein n=1 Tax=Hypocrea atroviridis (strain ATCC 20476 / IMI 206040) TaxID=452589 RepID=G9NUJ1_HYPAI|nr:uncharacterized protein TRIATDRAFT_88880 [Trichoderma atroviride IMI 206040]EHK45720.1 hypothetical protein TRIATDRAFT_88880 [Trichoderma atroviride IMI 206040]